VSISLPSATTVLRTKPSAQSVWLLTCRLLPDMDAAAARQAVDRFIDGAKLAADRLPAADREAVEADTVVALLQRVLHPRLRAMLGESNLAVRQVLSVQIQW